MLLEEHDGLSPVVFSSGGKKYIGLAASSFCSMGNWPWEVHEVYEISSMNLMVPNAFNPKVPQMMTQLHVNPPDFMGVLKMPLPKMGVSTVEWWYRPSKEVLALIQAEAARSVDVPTKED